MDTTIRNEKELLDWLLSLPESYLDEAFLDGRHYRDYGVYSGDEVCISEIWAEPTVYPGICKYLRTKARNPNFRLHVPDHLKA